MRQDLRNYVKQAFTLQALLFQEQGTHGDNSAYKDINSNILFTENVKDMQQYRWALSNLALF